MTRFGAAEIDALLQADPCPVGAQPPAAARGQAQQHRLAVLLQARLDRGMQVEAHHEGLRVGRLYRVFAADVLAAFGDVDAPAVDRAERAAPAVVAGVQPMRRARFLARHLDVLGPMAEPFWAQRRRAGFGDHQGGMRRRRPAGIAPFRPGAWRGAAIDDQPLAPDRQLEGQSSRMGVAIELGRRGGAAIHDQHRPPGLQAVEPALAQLRGHAPGPAGLGQHRLDAGRGFLAGAVEQRQAAVAVAHQPQCWAHALDGAGQRFRRRGLRGLQQGAYLDQVHQHRQLLCRRAFAMAAIGQDLAVQLLWQHPQRAGQEGGMLR